MKPPTSTIQHVLHTSAMLEQSSVTIIENIDMKGNNFKLNNANKNQMVQKQKSFDLQIKSFLYF